MSDQNKIQYLMRCDGCGTEGVMNREVGMCPSCRRLMQVYSCVCGCSPCCRGSASKGDLRVCSDCLDRVAKCESDHHAPEDGFRHGWRVVAEIAPYPPGADSFPAEGGLA